MELMGQSRRRFRQLCELQSLIGGGHRLRRQLLVYGSHRIPAGGKSRILCVGGIM
jgi:hypothetical protein